jgi:hypothetical protein
MNLATPSSIQKLQKALHDKAKGSPSFRFYALYDKVKPIAPPGICALTWGIGKVPTDIARLPES